MPDGSSSAAPVTKPGPSRFNQARTRLFTNRLYPRNNRLYRTLDGTVAAALRSPVRDGADSLRHSIRARFGCCDRWRLCLCFRFLRSIEAAARAAFRRIAPRGGGPISRLRRASAASVRPAATDGRNAVCRRGLAIGGIARVRGTDLVRRSRPRPGATVGAPHGCRGDGENAAGSFRSGASRRRGRRKA